MGTYNRVEVTKKLYESGLPFFSTTSLKQLLGIRTESGIYRVLQDLITTGVLQKLEAGKYMIMSEKPHQFMLANFLYEPSYISFETALNFHGILPQFPFDVTSATPNKPTKKVIGEEHFSYTQIKKSLYWGFVKKDNFLIAEPEKALLDQLYSISKGIRPANLDEYDTKPIRKGVLREYLAVFSVQTKQPAIESFLKQLHL